MIVLTHEVSKDAYFIMWSALCCALSVPMATLVIWPKIYKWAQLKYYGEPDPPPPHINVTGKAKTKVTGLSQQQNGTVVTSSVNPGVSSVTPGGNADVHNINSANGHDCVAASTHTTSLKGVSKIEFNDVPVAEAESEA
jgi:hypothetical protein